MNLSASVQRSITALEKLDYTVEIDPEDAPGVGRITGHGVLVTLPLHGAQADEAWDQWADHERHDAHLEIMAADAPMDPDQEAKALRDRLNQLEAHGSPQA
jgi:hypothetical protein